MSPIERAEAAVLNTVFVVEELSGHTIDNPREVVRAVLQAIREPSDGMVRDGQLYLDRHNHMLGNGRLAETWQAMIDAALSE